ncbi:TIGR00375 family protein [Heliobacillus mobilis]|uniref:TIGR00375 family protein n=1 Tax=Heliobacterium mobile TaxID=28064 RepID=A0A6I3SKU3_HELMO|nr:endonuclease Q family protein [Heliobacterium mobile]MTV49312.1 TIGR00375 family protein [Heliobacterium mobile]
MGTYFGDFHVHLGRSDAGRPIKITAAKNLTLEAALWEGKHRKGLDLLGVIDAACLPVISDLERLIERGELEELSGGGFRYQKEMTFLAGAEVETEEKGGPAHFLAYLPTLESLKAFSRSVCDWVTNPNLSSQHCRCRASDVLNRVVELEGVFVPAHAFTPHKGLFGQGVDDLVEAFTEGELDHIWALELGLSSDTTLADRIPGLKGFTYLSNSDAHSLPKIAREYNALELESPTFSEWVKALRRQEGRRIIANYGLDPRLGKYHRSACPRCETITTVEPPDFGPCPSCGAQVLTPGVLDRIEWLSHHGNRSVRDSADVYETVDRPPYVHQVPLEFLPGIGPKARQKLLEAFGTEMNLLHRVTDEEILGLMGPKIAAPLLAQRHGELTWTDGGGGRYGRVQMK